MVEKGSVSNGGGAPQTLTGLEETHKRELRSLQDVIAQHGKEREVLFKLQVPKPPEKVTAGITNPEEGLEGSLLETLARDTKQAMTSERKEQCFKQFQKAIGGGEWRKETRHTEAGYDITTYLPLEAVICMQTCNKVHDLNGDTIIGEKSDMYFIGQILNNLGIGLKSTSCTSEVYQELKAVKKGLPPTKSAQTPGYDLGTTSATQPKGGTDLRRLVAEIRKPGIPICNPFQQEPYYVKPEDIKPPLTEEMVQQLVSIQELYNKILEDQTGGKPVNIGSFKNFVLNREKALINYFGICPYRHTYVKQTGERLHLTCSGKNVNFPSYNMLFDFFGIKELIPEKDTCPSCKSIGLGR